MKRKLLSQILFILALVVSHTSFAKGQQPNNAASIIDPNSCTQTDKCFEFNYQGYRISADEKTVTLSFRIKTNCGHDLSYAAFEIPAKSSAVPAGTRKFNYKTEITNNPFRSIKFEGVGIKGYKNGAEDVFQYTLSKADFDKLTTIRVQAKASTTVGLVVFQKNCSDVPLCLVNSVNPTNVRYTVDGVTSGNLASVAKPGKNVRVCFTVPKSTGFSTYSFVSYSAPTATFDRLTASLQKVFSFQTKNVGPNGGDVCFEIKVPDCYYQIDFVKGCVIENLGPANSSNFYGDQARLLATATGGTAPCTPLCAVTPLQLSNIKYYLLPNTSPIIPELRSSGFYRFNNITEGSQLRVCFTVPASSEISTYSLVSYTAPMANFDKNTVSLQKVFDAKTINVTPAGGDYCMDINVPNCFFQVDLVKGCVNENLTPTTLYQQSGRLIGYKNGGTVACTIPTPTPTPTIEPEIIGNEGCTPGYWKQSQHFGNWAPLVPTGDMATKFFDIFPVCEMDGSDCSYQGLSADLTLLEALQLGGGNFNALARHAAAAYLNAKSKSVKYSFTTLELKDWVISAFKNGNAETIKNKLEQANEAGCPLGRSEMTATTAIAKRVSEMSADNATPLLTVVPNPFRHKAVVRFSVKKAEDYSVSLYNAHGKQVRVLKTGTASAGESVYLNVDGSALPEGLYLVRLATKSGVQTVKLILQK